MDSKAPTLKRRTSLQNSTDEDKAIFHDLNTKPYAEQAKWFLNAFWNDTFAADTAACEAVWLRTNEFVKLDIRKDEGFELDEFLSHKFLENLGETLTVLKLRQKLRQIDVDMNGAMSLTEYLLYKYNKSTQTLLRPQADPEEIRQAQELVNQARDACEEMQARLEERKQMVQAQAVKVAEAKAATAAVMEAKRENEAALAALQAEEDALAAKKADLERRSQEGGVVSRNRAAAELHQLNAEDPLPLRQAKILQGAACRKVDKALKAQQAAEAEEVKAREAAEEAQREAAQAVANADAKMDEALAFLEEVKSRAGSSEGSVWWMEREMAEMEKYRPSRRASVRLVQAA